ncbi:MAG: hypothetical protein H0X40_14690 [Chthoniobacterales bacterium]|nr:hypothetical protein [Chthoniobacterales bacterium]
MSKSLAIFLALLFLTTAAAWAQEEPGGLLIYREPGASSVEAIPYHIFQQNNSLFSTVVKDNGEHKRFKSGGVLALVPYPSATFDSSFRDTARTALEKIDHLRLSYPQVKAELDLAQDKWAQAEKVAEQLAATPPPAKVSRAAADHALPAGARLTGATASTATITYATGITSTPLKDLSPKQLLALNATSRTIQLPLGIELPVPELPRPAAVATLTEPEGLTARVDAAGRHVVRVCSSAIGVSDVAFGAWAFYVALPALLIILLAALVLTSRATKTSTMKTNPGYPPL